LENRSCAVQLCHWTTSRFPSTWFGLHKFENKGAVIYTKCLSQLEWGWWNTSKPVHWGAVSSVLRVQSLSKPWQNKRDSRNGRVNVLHILTSVLYRRIEPMKVIIFLVAVFTHRIRS
jgi:hypothetical protein